MDIKEGRIEVDKMDEQNEEYIVRIPSEWIERLEIDKNDMDIELMFNKDRIVIEKPSKKNEHTAMYILKLVVSILFMIVIAGFIGQSLISVIMNVV